MNATRLLLLPLLLSACAACLAADCGRERLLPRPAPLAVHTDSGLSQGEQRRLADIRRFLPPAEQHVLEATLANLASDPRLPAGEAEAGLKRALSGGAAAAGFCDRLRTELQSLRLSGEVAPAPPARVATAVPIAYAHEHWLSAAARRRFAEPVDLARAIRDGELPADAFAADAPLLEWNAPLFLTDAAELEQRGSPIAHRLCLGGQPAHSYVVVVFLTEELGSPLRVPTAGDAICLPGFVLPGPDADMGETCTGLSQFVTQMQRVGNVKELRLAR